MYALQWWIPDIKTRREALFAGHFGPMGVGAIFIVSNVSESVDGTRLIVRSCFTVYSRRVKITYSSNPSDQQHRDLVAHLRSRHLLYRSIINSR